MCVRATTKLWSYYKAVTSLQNLSLKIGRENGPGVTEDSLFMLLTVIDHRARGQKQSTRSYVQPSPPPKE